MSIKEVLFFRIPQFIQFKILGRFYANNKSLVLLSVSETIQLPVYKVGKLKLLFDNNSFKENYKFFNTSINILTAKDWRKDYKNDITSPLNYYNNIVKQNFEINGDVKFVAEVSRLHFLPFLSFKYVESRKKEYLYRIVEILEDWDTQNPYLNSINWTSGIEVAIRSVNIIYTHYILKRFGCLESEIDLKIKKHITYSYQFLKTHLSLYSSANNHLMAELMGLNVISSYFLVAEKERTKWKYMFYRQMEEQINIDGVHMELCTRYHSEVLDQINIGLSFIKARGDLIPITISKRFEKMFHFVEHVAYKGVETIFGDNDEGFVINPYFVSDFSLYDSQLKTSNYLFKTNYHSTKEIDFRNYLIFGENFNEKTVDKMPKTTFFKASGYCFMYDHKSEIKLSFDIGVIGDKISSAHGHSDIFHFNFQQGNKQLIVDPGTYQYHQKDAFWRNYFRGIRAHNTISISNKDHAIMNNRMSWIDRPSKPKTEFTQNQTNITCKSQSYAFKKEQVIHERIIDLNLITKKIVITDILKSNSNKLKEASFYLHFLPDLRIIHNQNKLIIEANKKVVVENKLLNSAVLIKGNSELPLGWYSNSYDVKEKSKSLILNLELQESLTLETNISYE